MINYHDRRFMPVRNSANGEVSPEVVTHLGEALAELDGDMDVAEEAHHATSPSE